MMQKTLLILGLIVCLAASGFAQQPAAATTGSAPAVGNIHTPDDPEILRETQQIISTPGYTGVVWWIPFEFWELSGAKAGRAPEKTREALKALRDYTIVGVMAAKVSQLGAFEYVSPSDLQKKVFLRDAAGNDYAAVVDVNGDAKNLADLMRPMLANALGRAGENFAMLFLPARDKSGRLIADALSKGQFSVVLKDTLGEPETIYLWRTPLTSVSTPRYCPVGKERVHANWEYCPWHGAKLTGK
jgi:hypothetical protein